jgi:hypothetical protein
VVENYDKTREAQKIAADVQNAVAAAAVLEIGAVGLGVIVTTIATTVALDVTGILMASGLALLGLFIIPAKRKQAKKEMRAKVAEMRETLITSLRAQFEREIQRSLRNIEEAIAPYSRFVRAERKKLMETSDSLTGFKEAMEQIRGKIDIRQ